MSRSVVLPKHEDDGSLVDYLEEDPEIPTQKYCIVSFLSPEKIIQKKEHWMFEQFVKWNDYDLKMKGQEKFLAFLAKKYELKVDSVLADHAEFEKIHRDEVKKTDIWDQYQVFLLKHEKELQEKFDVAVNFQTNVRGVKLRRSFATVEEAQVFAQAMRRRYPKDNLFIGKVGAWLPWDPSEHLMAEVEYAEKDLNEIMRKYKENESNKEVFFSQEREESIKKQKEENAKRAEDAKKAQAESAVNQLADASGPVHPTEGALRE